MESHDAKVLDIAETPEESYAGNGKHGKLPNDPLRRQHNEHRAGKASREVEGADPGRVECDSEEEEEARYELIDGNLLPGEEGMSRRGGLRHDKRLAKKRSNVKGAKKNREDYGKGKSLKDARRKYNRSSRHAAKQQLKNYNK